MELIDLHWYSIMNWVRNLAIYLLNFPYSWSRATIESINCQSILIISLPIGINKGDMIGIWSLNITNWVLIKFAADYLGAVLVTINPYYKTDELAYLIDKSKCKILFLPGENSTQLDYNNFTEIVQSNSFKAQVSQVN